MSALILAIAVVIVSAAAGYAVQTTTRSECTAYTTAALTCISISHTLDAMGITALVGA
jgi:hypothetical protein